MNVVQTPVDGFFIIEEFLTEEEEDILVQKIYEHKWKFDRTKKRRVQIYGPWHDDQYNIMRHIPPTPIPKFLKKMCQKINGYCNSHVNNVARFGNDYTTEIFINEYVSHSYLRYHTDNRKTYEELIVGVSALSQGILSFSKGSITHDINIPPRSMYVMMGDARYIYKHAVPEIMGTDYKRISVTVRGVK